jgi:hypothetical protein
VGVHVADLGDVDACVREGHPQGAGGIETDRVGIGDVIRVGGDAVADQFGVDVCAACTRMLEFLEH